MHDRAILKSQNTSMDRGLSTKKVMPPGAIARGFLQVGDDIIDCGASRIISRDPPVKITPKVLAVLLELARHQGETVARDTLLDTVWAETHPTPDVVKQAILEIRRALEYPAGSSEIVETIPRLGYRLLVKARFSETLEGLSEPEADLSDSPESTGLETGSQQISTEIASTWTRWLLPSAAALVLSVAAWWFVSNAKNDRSSSPVPLAQSNNPAPLSYRLLTSNLGRESMPAISPDGSRVAYVVENKAEQSTRIRIQTSDGQGATWLNKTSESQEIYPVWSGDGASLSYIRANDHDCAIVARPATGGDEKLLSRCWSRFVQLFDWSPDRKYLALSQYPTSSNKLGHMTQIDLEKQVETYLDYPKALASSDYEPHYSPDGRFIAFRRGVQPVNDLFVYDRLRHVTRQLTDFGASFKGFTWTPSSKYLVVSSNHEGIPSLYLIDVADGKISPLGIEDAEYPSMARHSQNLVFAKTRVTKRITENSLVATNRPKATVFQGSTGSDQEAVFSEDNDYLALVSNRSGVEQIWLSDRRHPEKELFQISSFNGERLSQLCWSPDSGKLLVVASLGKQSGLYSIDLARRTQILLTPKDMQVMQATFGDSERDIWFAAKRRGAAGNLWHAELLKGQYRFSDTRLMATEVRWIANGNRLLVNPASRNEYQIYDRDLKLSKSYTINLMPLFSRVRKDVLWYLGVAGNGFGLYRMSLDTGKSELVRDGLDAQWSYPWFDISKDEKYVLLTEIERDDTDIAIASLPSEIR